MYYDCNSTPIFRMGSVRFREEGNKIFISITDALSPSIRLSRLEKALEKYNQAFIAAENLDQKASAAKNVGTVNARIAFLLDANTEFERVKKCLSDAIRSFSVACTDGKKVKSLEWKSNILKMFRTCLDDVENLAQTLPFQKKISLLQDCADSISIDSIRAEYYLKIAALIFQDSINLLDEKRNEEALTTSYECDRPLEEAAKIHAKTTNNPELTSEINILREDLRFHKCRAESRHAVTIGDSLQEAFCKSSDKKGFTEMGLEVLDWYKKAVLASREIDVEMEAIALTRIGMLYDEVLDTKHYAKHNFKKAIELAPTLDPETFQQAEWYQTCISKLKKYETMNEHEDVKWNRERKVHLESMKEEVLELEQKEKEIQSESNGDCKFLIWLYQRHPPKQKNCVLSKNLPDRTKEDYCEYSAKVKNLFKKALIHFHPDRCEVKDHGEKWKVLTEEISKILTRRYEIYK